jgi:hypothetical protein
VQQWLGRGEKGRTEMKLWGLDSVREKEREREREIYLTCNHTFFIMSKGF